MKTVLKAAFVALLVMGMAAQGRADDDVDVAPTSHTEGYLGILLPYNSIHGDFDGNRIYTNEDGVVGVPDPDGALGLGLVLGLKSNRASGRGFAIEGSLQGSSHDSDFEDNTNLALISLDFKFFPTVGGVVEPWIQAGFSIAALEVERGFISSSGNVKDATYSGGGFNLGLGVMKYVSPRFALHLAGIYRFINYDEVDYGRRAELNEDLNGNTLSIEFGATYRFLRH